MKKNIAIIDIKEYNRLKSFERVIKDESETMFFIDGFGTIEEERIYYNSQAHFELMENNNSLYQKIKEQKEIITSLRQKINTLKKDVKHEQIKKKKTFLLRFIKRLKTR